MRSCTALGACALGCLLLPAAPARAIAERDIRAAIDRGVAYLKSVQQKDGNWPSWYNPGMTALAGLALLECDVPRSDPAVQKAALAVRRGCRQLDAVENHYKAYQTYAAATAVLFLDRLGEPADEPLLDALVYWLLTGQTAAGTWSYTCARFPRAEGLLLTEYLELVTDAKGTTGSAKERIKALAEEIPRRVKALAGQPPRPSNQRWTDHSNTQFAVLALWVGRRHGMPVDHAVAKAARHFLGDQNADGSWVYSPEHHNAHPDLIPADTCNGIVVLGFGEAVARAALPIPPSAGTGLSGAPQERLRSKGPAKPPGKNADEGIQAQRQRQIQARAGLVFLARFIALEIRSRRGRVPVVSAGGNLGVFLGRNFYCFLWSMEKMAAAYDLQTLGGLDWYMWGAEIVLANQAANGRWNAGEYDGYALGAHTCFALLFLSRSNLTPDLTAALKGQVRDPGQAVLKGNIEAIAGAGDEKPMIRPGGAPRPPDQGQPAGEENRAPARTAPVPGEGVYNSVIQHDAERLACALVGASPGKRGGLLASYQQTKGVEYTLALALAIPKLPTEDRSRVRDSLASRLTRMTPKTLRRYLADEDSELQAAAARAAGTKEDHTLVPDLIALLVHDDKRVWRAAHAALQALTGEDFGPAAASSKPERRTARTKWRDWWQEEGQLKSTAPTGHAP